MLDLHKFKCKNLRIKNLKDNNSIGRFSALSCANMVHITSFYNGKAYYYLMMKNGTKINIDEVSVTTTDEKNGVEVRIVVDNYSVYTRALKYLYYIPNLYVHTNLECDDIKDFNNRDFKRYNNFAVGYKDDCYYSAEPYLLIGDILYPYNYYKCTSKYGSYEYKDFFKSVQIAFNIGELDITPNREELLYSNRTIQAIEHKLEQVLYECADLAKHQQQDFDNIFTYYRYEREEKYLHLENFAVKVERILEISHNLHYTYKGIQLKGQPYWSKLTHFLNISLNSIPFVTVLNKGKILTTKQKEQSTLWHELFPHKNKALPNVKLLVLPSDECTRSCYFKQYLQEKYVGYSTVFVAVKPNLTLSYLKSIAFINSLPDKCYIELPSNWGIDRYRTIWLYHQVLLAFSSFAEEVDIINSEDFKQFKEDNKIQRNLGQKFPGQLRFYVSIPPSNEYYNNYYLHKWDALSVLELDKRIKNHSKVNVIYGSSDNPLFDLYDDLVAGKEKTYVVVKVAKTNIKYLKSVPNNWIPIEDIINVSNPEIIKLITYNQFKFQIHEKDKLIIKDLATYIPKKESAALQDILYYRIRLSTPSITVLNTLVTDFKKQHLSYDQTMLYNLKILKKYLSIAEKLRNLYSYDGSSYLFAYIAMKKKLIRLNNSVYQTIRTLLNFSKDENNQKQQ